jgi:hypothetical protein
VTVSVGSNFIIVLAAVVVLALFIGIVVFADWQQDQPGRAGRPRR